MTTDEHGCCAPAREVMRPARPVVGAQESQAHPGAATSHDQAPAAPGSRRRHDLDQAAVPAQVFSMGDADGAGNPGDGETPVHEVRVDAFSIDATTVTNAAFARFAADTGYRTESELFGYSAVFHLALQADLEDVVGQPPQTPWWLGVRGADWAHPAGPLSSLDGLAEHPVVQVSWNDALAYCA